MQPSSARPQSRRLVPTGVRRGATVAAALAVTSIVSGCGGYRDSTQANRLPSLRVADAALQSGAPDLALRVADLILEREPKNVQALTARGDALYALGQRGKARESYKTALSLDPSAPGAQVGLGRTLASSDPAAAESMFLAALEHDPENITALNNLGVVRDLQGRNTEAQTAYRQALNVSPGSADVQINLGMSLAVAGRKDEAVQVLRSAAAMPGAAQGLRKELAAALNLAGDGAWARTALLDGSSYSLPPAAPRNDRVAVAAATPSVPLTIAPAVIAAAAIAPPVIAPATIARVEPVTVPAPVRVPEDAAASGPAVAALSATVATAPSSVSTTVFDPPRQAVTQAVAAPPPAQPIVAASAPVIATPAAAPTQPEPTQPAPALPAPVATRIEPVPAPPMRDEPKIVPPVAVIAAPVPPPSAAPVTAQTGSAPVATAVVATPPSRPVAVPMAVTADHVPVAAPFPDAPAGQGEALATAVPRRVTKPVAAAPHPVVDVPKPAAARLADASTPRPPVRSEPPIAPAARVDAAPAPVVSAQVEPKAAAPAGPVAAESGLSIAVAPAASAEPAPASSATGTTSQAPAAATTGSAQSATGRPAATPAKIAAATAAPASVRIAPVAVRETAPLASRPVPDRLSSGLGLDADIVALAGPVWPMPMTLSDDIARYTSRQDAPKLETSRKPVRVVARASAPAGGTPYVQIGVYNSGEDAIINWVALTQKAGALLIDRQPTVKLDTLGGRPAWLLRTVGFANQADANRFCLQLKVAGQRCITGSTP